MVKAAAAKGDEPFFSFDSDDDVLNFSSGLGTSRKAKNKRPRVEERLPPSPSPSPSPSLRPVAPTPRSYAAPEPTNAPTTAANTITTNNNYDINVAKRKATTNDENATTSSGQPKVKRARQGRPFRAVGPFTTASLEHARRVQESKEAEEAAHRRAFEVARQRALERAVREVAERESAERARRAKEGAFALFKDGAKRCYEKHMYLEAARLFSTLATQMEAQNSDRKATAVEFSNAAGAYLMAAATKAPDDPMAAHLASSMAESALRSDAENYRAWLRLAKAKAMLGELAHATQCFLTVKAAAPPPLADEARKELEAMKQQQQRAPKPPAPPPANNQAAAPPQKPPRNNGAPPERAPPKFLAALNLERTCTTPDVKRAFKRQALKYHPDKNVHRRRESIEATNLMFREAKEAHNVLVGTSDRRKYLWNFDIVGTRMDIAGYGANMLIHDFDEETGSHHVVQHASGRGRLLELRLNPP